MFRRTCNLLSYPRIIQQMFVRNNSEMQKKSSSARLFAFSAMGLIVVGAGSTLIFAKYNPKLREIVQAHFPMADQIIKTVWQEGKLETSDTEDSP